MKNTIARLIYSYFLYSFTFTSLAYGQNLEDYNALYTKTYLETANEDFPRALHVADSLYSISETPLLQARSLMLTATLYQQKGEIIKSIEYAVKAEQVINHTAEVNWKTRIYGFLATQYRIARLFTPAKEYVTKAKTAAQNIKDPHVANITMGLITQEMAYHEMAHKRYKQAIGYILQAKRFFEEIQENSDFFAVENEQLLGLNYYLLGEENKALEHYKIALDRSGNISPNHVTALVYNGLANIYLNKNELLKAKEYLGHAKHIAEQSHYLQLKKEVNETAYKYYVRINDMSRILAIKTEQDSILSEIYRNSADFLNKSYTMLGHERQQLEQQSKNKLAFLIMGILVVLPITLYFVLPQFKQSKKQKYKPKPRHVIDEDKVEDGEHEEITHEIVDEENTVYNENGAETSFTAIIPEQVVHKIMIRLEEFERKHLYIKGNLSLSYLAIYCDTNAKYLSVVINSHKKKDFYNYINELRINYIVEKLQNNPYYRRLKIAALANEAGFSSQSKFALNFKKVTGISPSEFIKSLPEDSVE